MNYVRSILTSLTNSLLLFFDKNANADSGLVIMMHLRGYGTTGSWDRLDEVERVKNKKPTGSDAQLAARDLQIQ